MADDQQPSIPAQVATLVLNIANGRHKLSKAIPVVLFVLDALLCAAIILKVPYTEIDWVAYMEQVSQIVAGERNYSNIWGSTGPLVYPAGHVYVYTGLYYLTNEGKNILLAQWLFAGLYLATLAAVMACYWQAKVPPYMFPLLILSKRLHSIYVLRCFNDGVAALFMWLAIFFLQRRNWVMGSIFYSLGVSVKMTLLLSLPAVAVTLFLGRGLWGSLRLAWIMAQVQVVIGIRFWPVNLRGYVGRAFELSRKFLFRWTVNWRFVGEATFSSQNFSLALLGGHVAVLWLFIVTRWLRPAQRPLSAMIPSFLQAKSPFTPVEEAQVSGYVTAKYITTTVLSANVIGLLFARSLHYQFYAYLAWSTPYLLWRSGIPFPLVYLLCGVQEWAWNVYPSTEASSAVVVAMLAITVAAVWFGTANDALEIAPLPRPSSLKVRPEKKER
ncbi:ALG3-domain-containing protein [Sodiomyces alkalinus F11]|uniref:Dol-P-Man:Man(5)GlcNAc(2)-PP-Dol alpha-1,3-mannosyltransferase n=1 Tax=Sodiomyces alkalinus (strain CBS 110278 / VKM F-3762 / F11) TaxID=1314773 RepID=A0A3N2Q824_SODAK|nr:ALG3-domain-containing protein [Sodiomyces alkalinus F11]ROT42923.1 ALG3-domain-containing protein [Sodiomyces alkalinus F11]